MKVHIAGYLPQLPVMKISIGSNFHAFVLEKCPSLAFVNITYWHHSNTHSLGDIGVQYPRLLAMKKNRSSIKKSLWHSTVLAVLVRKTTRMTGERVAGHEFWQYWYTRRANIYFVLCCLYFTWPKFALKFDNNSLLSSFIRYCSIPSYYV